ncbi:MAG: SDR family NAD(P)-dependent oxidoreductase [Bradymonadaceae bacterium]
MRDDYEDKVVWITGGGTGIGKAVALQYAELGANVAVTGRRMHKLEEAVSEVEEYGGSGLAVQGDVTDEARVEEAVDEIVDHFGRLDVSIANAGYAAEGGIGELDADDWRRQLDVNVVGLVMTAKYSIPALMETGGRLGLTGSVAGTVPLPDEIAYSASKYAVRSIGQSLSVELSDTEVSCTTIQPGFVESEIVKRDNEDQVHEDWEDRRPQQFIWPADAAAEKIVKALDRRKREYTFTGHGRAAAFVGKHAPGVLHHALRMVRDDEDSDWPR